MTKFVMFYYSELVTAIKEQSRFLQSLLTIICSYLSAEEWLTLMLWSLSDVLPHCTSSTTDNLLLKQLRLREVGGGTPVISGHQCRSDTSWHENWSSTHWAKQRELWHETTSNSWQDSLLHQLLLKDVNTRLSIFNQLKFCNLVSCI